MTLTKPSSPHALHARFAAQASMPVVTSFSAVRTLKQTNNQLNQIKDNGTYQEPKNSGSLACLCEADGANPNFYGSQNARSASLRSKAGAEMQAKSVYGYHNLDVVEVVTS